MRASLLKSHGLSITVKPIYIKDVRSDMNEMNGGYIV